MREREKIFLCHNSCGNCGMGGEYECVHVCLYLQKEIRWILRTNFKRINLWEMMECRIWDLQRRKTSYTLLQF